VRCGDPKERANLTWTGDKMEVQRLKGCRYLLQTVVVVGSCAVFGPFTFIQVIKHTTVYMSQV